MGLVTGQKAYQRWQQGDHLTRQEAIEANCYVCNGGERGYCGGENSCALYRYSQFTRESLQKGPEEAGKYHSREISALAGT